VTVSLTSQFSNSLTLAAGCVESRREVFDSISTNDHERQEISADLLSRARSSRQEKRGPELEAGEERSGGNGSRGDDHKVRKGGGEGAVSSLVARGLLRFDGPFAFLFARIISSNSFAAAPFPSRTRPLAQRTTCLTIVGASAQGSTQRSDSLLSLGGGCDENKRLFTPDSSSPECSLLFAPLGTTSGRGGPEDAAPTSNVYAPEKNRLRRIPLGRPARIQLRSTKLPCSALPLPRPRPPDRRGPSATTGSRREQERHLRQSFVVVVMNARKGMRAGPLEVGYG
jgi:predicted Fe-S protein YdhL (DUF1289 family)